MSDSSSDVKSVPVFSATSIRAMSPIAKEIAILLQQAGYIRVADDAALQGAEPS
jgi:hypothetical protein